MKKIIMISIIFLTVIFINSYVYAADCGNYTFYHMNGNIDNTFYNARIVTQEKKCELTYEFTNVFGNKKSVTTKVSDCNTSKGCPKRVYAFCAGSTCESYAYKAYYDSTVPSTAWNYFEPSVSDEGIVVTPGQENDRYSDVETCTDVDVNHIKACGCIPAEVADITSKVYFILRLIGPIILLIIGGFEMAKAVAAQDESAIEKAKKKLVNKFIAAAAIFLVLTIIKFAVSLVADDISGVYKCIDILLDGYVI